MVQCHLVLIVAWGQGCGPKASCFQPLKELNRVSSANLEGMEAKTGIASRLEEPFDDEGTNCSRLEGLGA